MDPITIGLITGGALGLGKYMDGRMQADRQRKAEAEVTRYSPWTGMQGKTVGDPSMFGDVATGVAAGGTMGQGVDKMNADKALAAAMASKAPAAGAATDALSAPSMGMPAAQGFSVMGNGGSAGSLGAGSPWQNMMKQMQMPNYFSQASGY